MTKVRLEALVSGLAFLVCSACVDGERVPVAGRSSPASAGPERPPSIPVPPTELPPAPPQVPPSSQLPGHNEVGPTDPAATVLTFDERVGARIATAVELSFIEEDGIRLNYVAWLKGNGFFGFNAKSDGNFVVGQTVTLEVADHPVNLRVLVGSGPKQGEWKAERGQLQITLGTLDTVRIGFSNIVLDSVLGNSTRAVPSGELTGRLDRVCFRRVVDESVPPVIGPDGKKTIHYRMVGDPDWSSPFCQQFRISSR